MSQRDAVSSLVGEPKVLRRQVPERASYDLHDRRVSPRDMCLKVYQTHCYRFWIGQKPVKSGHFVWTLVVGGERGRLENERPEKLLFIIPRRPWEFEGSDLKLVPTERSPGSSSRLQKGFVFVKIFVCIAL
jgi:hypothetical protein